MPSEFSSNIREIAAELKLMDKKFAAATRKAIREVVTEAGADTVAAIREAARAAHTKDGTGLDKAAAGTRMRVSFAAKSGGAKITTSQKAAPYARALEGSTGGRSRARNRHPVFADKSKSRSQWTWVDQPTVPFFYDAAKKVEPVSEALLIARMDAAVAFAGFTG